MEPDFAKRILSVNLRSFLLQNITSVTKVRLFCLLALCFTVTCNVLVYRRNLSIYSSGEHLIRGLRIHHGRTSITNQVIPTVAAPLALISPLSRDLCDFEVFAGGMLQYFLRAL